MGQYQIGVWSYCTCGTPVCYFLAYVIFLPHIIYSLLSWSGRAFSTKMHMYWFTISFLEQKWLNHVLQDLIQSEKPNQYCSPGLGLPSFEVQLSFYIFVFILLHSKYHGIRSYYSFNNITLFLFAVFISWAVIFVGNHTFIQVLFGVVVGTISAIKNLFLLETFWIDDPHLKNYEEYFINKKN